MPLCLMVFTPGPEEEGKTGKRDGPVLGRGRVSGMEGRNSDGCMTRSRWASPGERPSGMRGRTVTADREQMG